MVVCVEPESAEKFVELARDLATPTHSRVVLLYAREVPATLPIDALQLVEPDTPFLDRFRAIVAGRGLSVGVETVDTRHAGRAVVECALAYRARVVVLANPRGRRRKLGRLAGYLLRHLDGTQLVLVSG